MPKQYQRVSKPLSCAECRRLKIKCDLRFPCRHCTKRGLTSICPDSELTNGSRRIKVLSSTEELHRRIATLEEVLVTVQPNHPILKDSVHIRTSAQRTQVANERRRLETAKGVEGIGNQPGNRPGGSIMATRDPFWHGNSPKIEPHAHLIMGLNSGNTRYYGAASSVYLSQKSIPTLDRVAESSQLASGHDILQYFQPTLPFPSHTLEQILTGFLPSIDKARRLADLFFEVFGCFTPIVLPQNWELQYLRAVFPGNGQSSTARPQEAAVVFFVLAIGSRVDTESHDHQVTASALATAARFCLALDMTHTLQFVRCLILYGYYIMNGGRDTSLGDVYWPLLRMVMGIVEALGLHREDSTWDMESSERMERRILFWECHTHDVMQSVNLGRGQCIASYAIDCPTVDVDGTGFHNRTWDLTMILSKINTIQIRVKPSPYSEILEIDREITAFERDLPPNLAPQITPSPFDLMDPAKRRLALKRNLLLLYVNETRVTLHRSSFVEAIRNSSHEPLDTDYRISYLACLEASRNIVALVRNVIAFHGRSVQMRWHYFFHLFSACICLAAAVIHAPRSQLATAAMVELNTGVELFRSTQRDELKTIIKRLRDHAENRIASGCSETEHHEDLDLLGARSQTIKTLAFTDLDLDFFFPQARPPSNAAPVRDFLFDAADLQDGEMQMDNQFTIDDLLGHTNGSQTQTVDDADIRDLLTSFGLS